MAYPFESVRAPAKDQEAFMRGLPNVSGALPEYFRALSVAYLSIEQKNLYNQPQGIRQSTGLTSSLNLLLVAMVTDRLVSASAPINIWMDTLRLLVLRWYTFGHDLNACLYFGYYYYTHKSVAEHEVKGQVEAIRFLVDENSRASDDPRVDAWLARPNSMRWYVAETHVGDKLHPLIVQKGDFARIDLPRPGYQITFKASRQYDLRVPISLSDSEIERPLVREGKAVMGCPNCGQKCRVSVFPQMQITCPKCKQVWAQSM